MNAISSVKAAWERPSLRRFQATDQLRAEILAQTEARRRAAAERRDR
jgi:hypothetical protein